jgi:hypothetical protein
VLAIGCGGLIGHGDENPTRVTNTNQNQCPTGQIYAKTLARCVQPVSQPVLPPYVIPSPDPYVSASDNYAYSSAVASKTNHNRTLQDQTITGGNLSVTASVALAGAIASIRYRGFELIASGGHGSAMQLITHDWTSGKRNVSIGGQIVTIDDRPTECNNPTEGGNMQNDQGQAFPHHGPSSSYIGVWGQDTVGGLPRIYSKVTPVDYIPPQSWSEDSGHGACFNTSSSWFRGYQFHKHVLVGYQRNATTIANVIQVDSTIEVGQGGAQNFDAILVAYLSRYFTDEYRYHVKEKYLVKKARGTRLQDQGASRLNECLDSSTQLPFVPIFASGDGGLAVAMLPRPGKHGTEAYSQTQFDHHTPSYSHRFRNIGVRLTARNLGQGARVPFKVVIFIGSLAAVQADILTYCSLESCSGPAKNLGFATDARIFNWSEYLGLNPDLPYTTRGDAISHWILYGLREGRQGSSAFWSPSYLAKHADVNNYARTSGYVDHCKGVVHYLRWGIAEGREP